MTEILLSPYWNAITTGIKSKELYITNHSVSSANKFIDKVNLTSLARVTILNFEVSGFEVSPDGKMVIYSKADSVKIRDLFTSKESLLETDILRFISISPV